MLDRVEIWKRAFEQDEQGILSTLINLTWNFAAYATVVRLVQQAPDNGEGGKRLNGMILELLASGFWGSTVMAIRRLVDNYSLDGDRGVNSLRAIVSDAKRNRHRLTRQVYVETIAGLDYDFAAVRERYWKFVLAHDPGPVGIPRELQYEPSEQRHQEFDWLSGIEEGDRRPDDVIREDVFRGLETRLSALDTIADHGNIYFAHAATEASRAGRGLVDWNYADAKDAVRQVAEIAEFVGRWFCYAGIGDTLPHAQYDQFAFLDQPLFTGDVGMLQAGWQTFADEVARWPFVENQSL